MRDALEIPPCGVNPAQASGNAGSLVRPDWWHRASHPDGPSRTIGTKANASITLDRPSPTITATEEKGGGVMRRRPDDDRIRGPNRASDVLLATTGRRRLTIEECALLQGFPADYPWQGNKSQRYALVGNAVPPRMAEVLGNALVGNGCTQDDQLRFGGM